MGWLSHRFRIGTMEDKLSCTMYIHNVASKTVDVTYMVTHSI